MLYAAAVLGRERLHAAVRVEAPGAGRERALARDLGELTGVVVADVLAVQANGGVRGAPPRVEVYLADAL